MMIRVVHFAFFSPVPVLVHVRRSLVAQLLLLRATACSASRPLSTAVGLLASLPNCSHSSIGRRCHPTVHALSNLRVEFVSSAARCQRVAVQRFPTLGRLSCWSTASSLLWVLIMTLLHLSKRYQMGSIERRDCHRYQ